MGSSSTVSAATPDSAFAIDTSDAFRRWTDVTTASRRMTNGPSQRSVSAVMFSVSSRKPTTASCVTATDAAETSRSVEATTLSSSASGAPMPWTRSTSPPVTVNAAVPHRKADGRRRECDSLCRHAGDGRGNDGVRHGDSSSG